MAAKSETVLQKKRFVLPAQVQPGSPRMSPQPPRGNRGLSFPSVLITITPQSRLRVVSIGFPPKPRFISVLMSTVLGLRYRGKCLFLSLLRFFESHSDTYCRNTYTRSIVRHPIPRCCSSVSVLSIRLCFSPLSSPFPLDFHFSTAFIDPSDFRTRPTQANLSYRVLCTVVVIPYCYFFRIAVA